MTREERAFAPHCDQRVLHAPGTCTYCDHYDDWQHVRELWGISFTGDETPGLIPCPSTFIRDLQTIEMWPGNRPKIVETRA